MYEDFHLLAHSTGENFELTIQYDSAQIKTVTQIRQARRFTHTAYKSRC
jgi:hypothetical protein